MRKLNKFIIFFLTSAIAIVVIKVAINAQMNASINDTFLIKPPLIGQGVYLSNRYSLPENNEENGILDIITENYELISENDHYELYLNREDVIFKVRDKTLVNGKNYVWASAVDQILRGDSGTNLAQMMLSSFVVEYYNINSTTGEIVTNTTKLFLHQAEKGSIYYENQLAENISVTYQPIDSGIQVNIIYTIPYELSGEQLTSTISFSAEVTINNEGLHVNIPHESIVEGRLKLAYLYVMPFLGATRLDDTPGYMFIPDGTGALMRYKDSGREKVNQVTYKYYGKNDGAKISISQVYTTDNSGLTMPVFGAVHGVKQNAFLGIIENGDFNAELLVNRNGTLQIDYNWITPRFILRDTFNLYRVNQTVEQKITPEDITINYHFLSNTDADYVGMAKSYQQYLVKLGDLKKNEDTSTPLRLEILASDSTKGLFGEKIKTMTTIKDANAILTELENNQINDLLIVMKGWNEGGYSGHTPYSIRYERSVGSENEFQNLINKLNNKELPLYFYNDYVIGYDNSKQVNQRRDVAKGLNRVQLTFNTPNEPVYKSYYYINPSSSFDIAENDLQYYKDHKIQNIALDSIGNTIFSYYNDKSEYTRYHSQLIYDKLLVMLGEDYQLSLYQPNAYMWKHTENYFDIPMYSSQYTYYTDSVPFIQVVLKGYINYYAPYSNFFVDSNIQRLQMIDYGMYPSYIITDNETYQLKYTNANDYFTTQYKDFKKNIIDEYNIINLNLQSVANATIESREVIEPGIVKVTYSNSVTFIINYTNDDYTYEDLVIKAVDFIKIGVM